MTKASRGGDGVMEEVVAEGVMSVGMGGPGPWPRDEVAVMVKVTE